MPTPMWRFPRGEVGQRREAHRNSAWQIARDAEVPALDPRAYVALPARTLARLDNKPVNDDNLAAYLLDRLNDKALHRFRRG